MFSSVIGGEKPGEYTPMPAAGSDPLPVAAYVRKCVSGNPVLLST